MPPVTVDDLLEQKRRQQDSQTQESRQLTAIEQAIYKSIAQLATYLDGTTSKTEVVNQLKEIGTPDALKVVDAVNQLHDTLKTHKNTDLSEVTTVMKSVLAEAKKIPKENPKFESVDYSKQFAGLTAAIKGVEKVVKEQKLIAKAPIVKVPETKVNVAAPNLLPLQGAISEVVTAVKKIAIPEYKPDNTEIEKQLKASNKLLKNLLDKPMGGFSGGGGGGIPAFRNSAGNPDQPTLDSSGNVPVVTNNSLIKVEYDAQDYSNSDSTHDIIDYYQGGLTGTKVGTVTITYTDSTKATISSIVRT